MRQTGSSRACAWRTTFGVSVVAACVFTACTGSASSPTAASRLPDLDPPSLPSGPPIAVTLVGRVTETDPTPIIEVPHAIVRVMDGPDAGRSAETNELGYFTIERIRPGKLTVSVSAEGFVSASQAIDIGVQTTVNFKLARTFKILTYSISGDLKASDGTCSDGLAERPCRIVAFPVHNGGAIDADLDWNPNETANLDIALFQAGGVAPIARSANPGKLREHVRSTVPGRAVYELHITYAGGTSPATYLLTLSYPN